MKHLIGQELTDIRLVDPQMDLNHHFEEVYMVFGDCFLFFQVPLVDGGVEGFPLTGNSSSGNNLLVTEQRTNPEILELPTMKPFTYLTGTKLTNFKFCRDLDENMDQVLITLGNETIGILSQDNRLKIFFCDHLF